MAITIRYTCFAEISTPTGVIQVGKASPTSVTAAGGTCEDRMIAVTNGVSEVIWKPSITPAQISNFDFLWMVSDQPVVVQFVSAIEGAHIEYSSVSLVANAPFALCEDACFDNRGDVNFMSTIDIITVYNNSGSTANVRIFLAT